MLPQSLIDALTSPLVEKLDIRKDAFSAKSTPEVQQHLAESLL